MECGKETVREQELRRQLSHSIGVSLVPPGADAVFIGRTGCSDSRIVKDQVASK